MACNYKTLNKSRHENSVVVVVVAVVDVVVGGGGGVVVVLVFHMLKTKAYQRLCFYAT